MPNVYRNIARDYIEKYQKQVSYLRYLATIMEIERSRAENVKSANNIPGGVLGGIFYPYETSGTVCPGSKEDELVALAEASKNYDEQKQVVEGMTDFIVKSVYDACEIPEAEAFLYINILNMKVRDVGMKLNYSVQRIYQLNSNATKKLGKLISLND